MNLLENKVAGICECWDFEDFGMDVVREHVVGEVEQAKQNGLDLNLLAVELGESVATDEGWTLADARLLKDVFSQYGVVFKAEI